jgi:hypothetical protein
MRPSGPSFRRRFLALTGAALTLASCAESYQPRPIAMPPPDKVPNLAAVPGTGIKVSVLYFNHRRTLHDLFPGKHGLWRGHVAVVQLTVSSEEKNATDVLIDSAYIAYEDHYYPAISPRETYDVAWPAANPLASLKEDLFNVAVIGFTIITLGVGSVIWVLPTPFSQPAPDTTPFGRDLNYKALTNNISLEPGTFRSGFLFFHLPKDADLADLKGAQLVLHVVTKTPTPTDHVVIFDLPAAASSAAPASPGGA